MASRIKEILRPLTGIIDRFVLDLKTDEVTQEIGEVDAEAQVMALHMVETRGKFAPRDRSLVNGRPHHLDKQEAAKVDPSVPARRP